MADTRYYRIAPKIWRHAMVHHWQTETTVLALYLLTCPHRNIAGLYVLPLAYITADLALPMEIIEAHLHILRTEDFIQYDDENQVLFLRNALAYDAPENGNQRKGAVKALQEVPGSFLWRSLWQQARCYAPEFARDVYRLMQERFPDLMTETELSDTQINLPMPEPLPKQFDKPLEEPLPKQNGNPVSVTVSVPVTVSQEKTPARERTWDRAIPESVGTLLTVLDAQKPILTTGTDDLVRWHVEGMQWEVVARGLQTAIDLQKPFAYAQAILRGWRQEGKLTLAAFTGENAKAARPRDKPASRASPEIIPSPEEEAFWQRQYAAQAGGHEP